MQKPIFEPLEDRLHLDAMREPQVFDVPVQFAYVDFQAYLDGAIDGDIFNLYKPDNQYATTTFQGNYRTDNSITINGNGLGFKSRGNSGFTVEGNADVRFNDVQLIGMYNIITGEGTQRVVEVRDDASFESYGSTVSGRYDGVYFDSTGSLTLEGNDFSGGKRSQERQVYVSSFSGSVDISLNTFHHAGNPIVIGSDEAGAELNVLNNTIDNYIGNGITIGETLDEATGNILNNSMTRGNAGIAGESNKGDVRVSANNYQRTIDVLAMAVPGTEVSYNLDPMFVDADDGDYRLDEDSPLIDKGENTDDTTWFADYTWIGRYGAIPEPATFALVGLGLPLLLRKKEKR